MLTLVSLKLNDVSVIGILNDASVAVELLLEILEHQFLVDLRVESLHRRQALTSVALLHANVNVVFLNRVRGFLLFLLRLFFVSKVKRLVSKGIVGCVSRIRRSTFVSLSFASSSRRDRPRGRASRPSSAFASARRRRLARPRSRRDPSTISASLVPRAPRRARARVPRSRATIARPSTVASGRARARAAARDDFYAETIESFALDRGRDRVAARARRARAPRRALDAVDAPNTKSSAIKRRSRRVRGLDAVDVARRDVTIRPHSSPRRVAPRARAPLERARGDAARRRRACRGTTARASTRIRWFSST